MWEELRHWQHRHCAPGAACAHHGGVPQWIARRGRSRLVLQEEHQFQHQPVNCHPLRSQTYTIQELLNTTTGFARVGELSKHRVEFVQNLRTDQCAPERAPGLNIRDCARSLNNCVPRRPEQNAIDVTAKTIFEPERLYLVSLRNNWEDLSPCPRRPHSHRSRCVYFSIFVQFFPRVAPQPFCQLDSTSNLSDLAESRYSRVDYLSNLSFF